MHRVTDTLRNRKAASKVIKELDAFPKIPQDYQETSASGGTVSVFVFVFIGILVVSEFMYYRGTEMQYSYEVDNDAESKMKINVDITVAMKCDDVGADVLDLSGTSIDTESHLKLDETYFRLDKKQALWRDLVYKHQADGYRTINDVLDMYATSGGKSLPTYMPPRDDSEFNDESFDACRIYGGIDVNKVAGNFHITAGKSIPHPRGHAHLSALVSEETQNFSHRIDRLSFGSPIPGVINPLDGDIQLTTSNYAMYQYYIKIVPTNIRTNHRNVSTNQFSVTQRQRLVSPFSGGRGVPGIYFKYDFSPLLVRVTEKGRPFWQFLVRLCGIIGGIFATSGMMHSLVGFLFDEASKRYSFLKNTKQTPHYNSISSPASTLQTTSNTPATQMSSLPITPLPEVSTNANGSNQFSDLRLVQPEDLPEDKVA